MAPANEKRRKFDAVPTLAVTKAGVSSIPGGAGFTKRLVEWARGWGILGTFRNTDTGWADINVTATSIRDVNSHKAGLGKLAVLEVAPDLIRNGIYLETTWRNARGVASHIFAGKVAVDGVAYIVGFSVNEDTNGKRYYNHELTEIKEAPGGPWAGAKTAQVTASNREHISSIVHRCLFVNE